MRWTDRLIIAGAGLVVLLSFSVLLACLGGLLPLAKGLLMWAGITSCAVLGGILGYAAFRVGERMTNNASNR